MNGMRAVGHRAYRLPGGRRGGEEGQELFEYALVVALVALACVGALTVLGINVLTFLYDRVIASMAGF